MNLENILNLDLGGRRRSEHGFGLQSGQHRYFDGQPTTVFDYLLYSTLLLCRVPDLGKRTGSVCGAYSVCMNDGI